MKLQVLFYVMIAALLAGCSSAPSLTAWSGPSDPAPVANESWSYDGHPARLVRTEHYSIHTTLKDERVISEIAQVMEGAYSQYLKLVPNLVVSTRPMDCFVFGNRADWEAFTRTNAGPNAATYLKINRGGYAIRDWYVAYYLGNHSTYSVASHEGWHQFCGRNFKSRLPPFLEEGVATLFEGVSLAGPHGLPQWNLSMNLNRAVRLREVVQEHRLIPLSQLVTLHAGQVVASQGVDAFYAQNWAFARFMWEGENGKYRPVLHRLLNDVAAGITYDPVRGTTRPAPIMGGWNPDAVKGILEHYFNLPFDQIEKEYMAFVSQIAFEQFNAQWQS